jgi:hypothetical protein
MKTLEITQSDIKKEIKNRSIVTRALHKAFPNVVSRSLERSLRVDAQRQEATQREIDRREALGPKGRILEDAQKAVLCDRPTTQRIMQDRQEDRRYPISGYYDSISSRSSKVADFLGKSHLDEDSAIGKLGCDWFSFSIPIGKHCGLEREEDNKPIIFLSGWNESDDRRASIRLSDELMDSLGESDLHALEIASAHARRVTSGLAGSEALKSMYGKNY